MLMIKNMNMVKNITEALLLNSKEVGLEVNFEKTKYMLMPSKQNAGYNQNTEGVKEPFKNVIKLKYLEMTLANQDCMHEVIKSGLNSENTICQLVEHPFFFSFYWSP